jgi:hypothetical protein
MVKDRDIIRAIFQSGDFSDTLKWVEKYWSGKLTYVQPEERSTILNRIKRIVKGRLSVKRVKTIVPFWRKDENNIMGFAHSSLFYSERDMVIVIELEFFDDGVNLVDIRTGEIRQYQYRAQ